MFCPGNSTPVCCWGRSGYSPQVSLMVGKVETGGHCVIPVQDVSLGFLLCRVCAHYVGFPCWEKDMKPVISSQQQAMWRSWVGGGSCEGAGCPITLSQGISFKPSVWSSYLNQLDMGFLTLPNKVRIMGYHYHVTLVPHLIVFRCLYTPTAGLCSGSS